MVISRIKSILIGCIIVACSILLFGCAAAPIQEMSDARQSLQAAYDAGADEYAATTLQSAEMALERAEQKLGDRAFKEARVNAKAAKAEAMNAQEIALAIGAAKDAISSAANIGKTSPEAEALLQQAEQAARQGDKKEAVNLANEAKLKAAQLLEP